jgi:hypothetical protein
MLNAKKKKQRIQGKQVLETALRENKVVKRTTTKDTQSRLLCRVDRQIYSNFKFLTDYLGSLSILLTIELGSVDEIGQSGLSLSPLTSLETTVRVDPQLFWLEIPSFNC